MYIYIYTYTCMYIYIHIGPQHVHSSYFEYKYCLWAKISIYRKSMHMTYNYDFAEFKHETSFRVYCSLTNTTTVFYVILLQCYITTYRDWFTSCILILLHYYVQGLAYSPVHDSASLLKSLFRSVRPSWGVTQPLNRQVHTRCTRPFYICDVNILYILDIYIYIHPTHKNSSPFLHM